MKCKNCGNEHAFYIRGGAGWEMCDKCGAKPSNLTPDVSAVHEPYFDEHLCDKEHKNGQWIYSRGQKAEILNKMGLREKRESNIPFIKDTNARTKWFKERFQDA